MSFMQRQGTGIGAENAWTSSVPTTNKWEDIDDYPTPDDATAYLFATNGAPGTQLFTFTAFDVPAGSTITAVRVKWRGQRATAAATLVIPNIRTGTTTRSGTSTALTDSWADYTSVEWTTNPATSAAWEVDEVNGTDPTTTHRLVEFGMTSNPSAGREARVTMVYVEVEYTAPAGGGKPGYYYAQQ